MNNPYRSPTTAGEPIGDNRRTLIALVPFAIAVPCLIAECFLWFWSPLPKAPNAIAFGIFGTILIFDLPVCVLVAIQWLATGEPPPLSLSPLIPCREEREFRRNLRDRPKLNDDEFYDCYYANSSIPKHLPVQLRASLERVFFLDFGALHPTDNLIHADLELDWTDLVSEIDDKFNVIVPDEMARKLDLTFDSLLQCIVGNEDAVLDREPDGQRPYSS